MICDTIVEYMDVEKSTAFCFIVVVDIQFFTIYNEDTNENYSSKTERYKIWSNILIINRVCLIII